MDKKALGKGLAALIPDKEVLPPGRDIMELPLDKVLPNPLQPRKHFSQEQLQELINSIKEFGVVQPVIVMGKGDHYQLVIGERRWRAAKQAGLKTIPALIKEYSPAEGLQVALIENIQRQDLNPIEEANAFKFLLKEHNITHEDLARRLGKSRSTLTNAIRLLQLPFDMQKDLAGGEVNAGHARALLNLEDANLQKKLWEQIKTDSLSVRQVEKIVQKLKDRKLAPSKPAPETELWAEIREALQEELGCKVMVKPGPRHRGKVEIYYTSEEELAGLVEVILRRARIKRDLISML